MKPDPTERPDSVPMLSGDVAPGGHKVGQSPLVKQFCQCILVAGLAYASYFLISHFVVQSVEIVGQSMSPTLQPQGRYLLNRWIYCWRNPQQSEIVVLRDPVTSDHAVKRIIAGAGDTVYIKNGRVYVNGQLLHEAYLLPGTTTFTYAQMNELFVRCGRDEYFVLGDNRRDSADSRIYGPVPRQNILGALIR